MSNYSDVFGNFTVPPAEARYSSISLSTSGSLVWPTSFSGEVDGEYPASSIIDVSSQAPSLQLLLPAANQVSVGQDLLLRNVGPETLDIIDAGGNPLTTLTPGESKYLYVISNTTLGGQWGVFTYGAGTSGADALLLAGRGLRNDTNRLHVNAEYRGLNSDFDLTEDNRGQLIDITVGSLVVTTPDAFSTPDGFYCFIRNSSIGSSVLEGFGSQSVNGAVSKTLSPGDSLILLKAREDWVTVGFGQDVEFTFTELVVNAGAGNVTLSSSDVAGRMIRVTGTATADITITLPAVDNIYFVNVENGMGVYTVTLTAGSGTVVVLNANEKTALYSDGANVSIAITTTVTSTLSLVDGSAAAPSIFFALDTNTGFFRKGNDIIGITAGGTERLSVSPTGLELQTPLAIAQGGTAATTAPGALANLGATPNTRNLIAGGGLTGGGTLAADRTFALGAPSTITTATPNSVSGTTHTHALILPVSDQATQGIIQIASGPEVAAGSDHTKAVTPLGLTQRTSTEARTGLIELATAAEVVTGTDLERAVTPAGLSARTATDARTGLVELATSAETVAGLDTSRAVTPAALKAALLAAFPVGAIYITAGNTNPGTFLGGTWTQIAQGRTLIGVGTLDSDTYAAGATGGAARVTLGINELPSHNHNGATGTQSANHTHSGTTASAGTHTHTTPLSDGGYFQYSGGGGTPGINTPLDADGTTSSAGDHTHTFTTAGVSVDHTHSIVSQGGGAAHENRMPYFVVHFWQRTA